jgi:hypothetical protein
MDYKEDILRYYGSQEIDFGELCAFVVNNYGEKEEGEPGRICAVKFEQIMKNILGEDAYDIAKYVTANPEASRILKWRYVTNLKDSVISESHSRAG